MSKKIAEIISFVLNPLVILIPLPFFLVYEETENLILSLLWSIWSILFIFLFFLVILLGIKFKFFSDLDVSKREQRPLLFFIGLIFSIIYIISLFIFHGPLYLFLAIIIIVTGLIILGIVNINTKVSGHLLVLSGAVTFSILAEEWKGVLSIPLIPILIWARIKTKNHTLKQTLLGTLLGILIVSIFYVIVKYGFNVD